MAKTGNQKLKILYLMKILMEKTDESHSLTMAELISELEGYGISAERKSIYSDIESLRQYGMDIIGIQQDRTYHYYIGRRQFELAELKLLVDSVQSAKFITARKSRELIKKIEGLASIYEAKKLHRQVYVTERIKTMNESIYYNVDKIHTAIGANVRIRFQYFQWSVDKKIVLRREGAFYEVSPWALTWNDENYYLIAYDSREEKIKHFRVDKMLHIEQGEEKREGKECFQEFDMAVYAKKMFGMFGGQEEVVGIRCENQLAGVVIDRFGKDVLMIQQDEEHFLVNAKVAVSRQFLAWVMGLGPGVEIVSPTSVVKQMQEEVARLAVQYQADHGRIEE